MSRSLAAALLAVSFILAPTLARADDPPGDHPAAIYPRLLEPPPGEDQILDSPEAREQYDAEKIDIDPKASHPTGHRAGGHTVLTGVALYDALERPDLVARYQRHVRRRRYAFIGAGLGAGVSLFFLVTLDDRSCAGLIHEEASACSGQRNIARNRHYLYATTTGIAALALLYMAVVTSIDPVDSAAAIRIADTHNNRLRRRLGLLDVALAPAADSALWLIPALGLDGATLTLGGQF